MKLNYWHMIIAPNSDWSIKKDSEDEKERGNNTIEYLNLNFSKLVKAIKNIFVQIETYKQQNFNINQIFSYFKEFETIFKQSKGEKL